MIVVRLAARRMMPVINYLTILDPSEKPACAKAWNNAWDAHPHVDFPQSKPHHEPAKNTLLIGDHQAVSLR